MYLICGTHFQELYSDIVNNKNCKKIFEKVLVENGNGTSMIFVCIAQSQIPRCLCICTESISLKWMFRKPLLMQSSQLNENCY